MTSLNKTLLAVLAVQLVLAVALRVGSGGDRIAPMEPVIAEFDLDGVNQIDVFGKDDESAGVVLGKATGSWTLASHFNYPVEGDKVDELLSKLKALQSRGPIAESKARHKQLGVAVDDFRRKVVLQSGGKSLTVWIGGSAGTRKTALRLDESEAVYGVVGINTSAAGNKPSNWVETKYFEAKLEDVESATVAATNGNYEFTRDGDAWKVTKDGLVIPVPEGKELNKGRVESVIRQALNIRLAEPADPKSTGAVATATVRMKKPAPAEGEDTAMSVAQAVHVIEIGPATDKKHWVRKQGAEHTVLVGEHAVKKLVTVDSESFFTEPPKPGEAPKGPPGGMPGVPGGMPGGMQLPPGTKLPPGMQMPPR
jgi:hypothetical protein